MNQSFLGEILSVMPTATDPNMGLFDSLCTIQVPDGVLGASGAPSGNFVNVAGLIPAGNIGVNLINIPCMESVPSTARVQATEVKDLAEIMVGVLGSNLTNVVQHYFRPQDPSPGTTTSTSSTTAAAAARTADSRLSSERTS